MTPHAADIAEGASIAQQWIGRELQHQREALLADAAQFDAWQSQWRARQTEIDLSFDALKAQLAAAARPNESARVARRTGAI